VTDRSVIFAFITIIVTMRLGYLMDNEREEEISEVLEDFVQSVKSNFILSSVLPLIFFLGIEYVLAFDIRKD